MFNNKILGIILLAMGISLFSACEFGSQKANEKKATTENVISEELHQEHCDLLAEANENLAGINQKVRTLNEKIREKNVKFTDELNAALDDFEAKQSSINKRMKQIKNVPQENWDSFKSTFEKDLVEINALIDGILADIE